MKLMNSGNQDLIVYEKLEKISKDYKKSFFINIEEQIDRLYMPIYNKAETVAKKDLIGGDTKKYYFDKTPNELNSIKDKRNDLLVNFQDKEHESIINLLQSLEKPIEILYLPSDNPEEQRVFICEE